MISPSHYQGNDVVKEQPIEIMYRSMTPEAFEGYCIGNIFKYVCRFSEYAAPVGEWAADARWGAKKACPLVAPGIQGVAPLKWLVPWDI